MNGITLKNPVVNSVPVAIAIGRKSVDVNGMSLSTGKKVNNDVVSSFLGEGLGNRAKVLGKLLDSMGYSKNIVRTAEDSLASIAETFSDMLGIVNSVGGSETAIRTLNDIFQSKIEQSKLQINTAEFDGRKILTGELGSDAIVQAKFNTKPVDVRKIGTGSSDLFETLGAKNQKNIQVNNDITKIKEGDTIRLEGVVFTMMDAQNVDKDNENHIAIADTPEETAGAIVTAIKNHSSELLRIYDVFSRVSDLGKLVVIQQRSQSASNISLVINSPTSGIIDNSQPSGYSMEFYIGSTGAAAGSFIEIYGQRFVFGPAGPVIPNTTYVDGGGNSLATAINFEAAVNANVKIREELIKEKMFSISRTSTVINIKSTLDASLLGFNASADKTVTGLNLYQNLISQSSATIYASKLTKPAAGNPAGNMTIAGAAVDASGTILNINDRIILFKNLPGAVVGAVPGTTNYLGLLIKQGKLSLAVDTTKDELTFYSDIDLAITTAIAGNVITPEPISPNDVTLIKAAIDVSNIKNLDGFIGTPSADFRVITQATGTAAEILYKQSTSQATIPGAGEAAVNDSVAIVEVKIAGKTFQSTIWREAVVGNLNNRDIVFREGINGESFIVRTRNFDADFTTLAKAGETLAVPLRQLFESTLFAQTRDLDIDTSNEKIITDEGEVIGDVTGMTASLNSTDFTNKEINDFKIISNPANANQALFVATISGVEFNAILDVAVLNEGASIKLMADNGDSLTINVGKDGLKSLTTPQNYKYVSTAIKKSLMKIGSGLDVRMGLDTGDSLKLFVADMSVTKLYRNNKNEYVPKLDLLSKENVKVAQEVITNALNVIRSVQSNIHGQGENINQAADSLSSATAVTKDASAGYLDTDLTEAASKFSAGLKSILAAISTLKAGANVADDGLEIIKSAAAAA
jgi:hypothetical protein